METGEMQTGFWCRELRERDHLEDLDIDGKIILQERQCTFKRNIEVVCLTTVAVDKLLYSVTSMYCITV
jgi:hypothetical protein